MAKARWAALPAPVVREVSLRLPHPEYMLLMAGVCRAWMDAVAWDRLLGWVFGEIAEHLPPPRRRLRGPDASRRRIPSAALSLWQLRTFCLGCGRPTRRAEDELFWAVSGTRLCGWCRVLRPVDLVKIAQGAIAALRPSFVRRFPVPFDAWDDLRDPFTSYLVRGSPKSIRMLSAALAGLTDVPRAFQMPRVPDDFWIGHPLPGKAARHAKARRARYMTIAAELEAAGLPIELEDSEAAELVVSHVATGMPPVDKTMRIIHFKLAAVDLGYSIGPGVVALCERLPFLTEFVETETTDDLSSCDLEPLVRRARAACVDARGQLRDALEASGLPVEAVASVLACKAGKRVWQTASFPSVERSQRMDFFMAAVKFAPAAVHRPKESMQIAQIEGAKTVAALAALAQAEIEAQIAARVALTEALTRIVGSPGVEPILETRLAIEFVRQHGHGAVQVGNVASPHLISQRREVLGALWRHQVSWMDFDWSIPGLETYLEDGGNPMAAFEAAYQGVLRRRSALEDALDAIGVRFAGIGRRWFTNYVLGWTSLLPDDPAERASRGLPDDQMRRDDRRDFLWEVLPCVAPELGNAIQDPALVAYCEQGGDFAEAVAMALSRARSDDG